jgi:hypothetical protein
MGRKYELQTRINKNWPIWGKPTSSDLNIWRSALKSTFCTSYDRKLKQPLGRWKFIPPSWKWFLYNSDSKNELLAKLENDVYKVYPRAGCSRVVQRFLQSHTLQKKGDDSEIVPTTVTTSGKYLIAEGFMEMEEIPTESQTLNMTENSCQWLEIDKHVNGNIQALVDDFQSGTLLAVSDGSYYEQTGKAGSAWIISSQNKCHFIMASSLPPEPSHIQSAYRSELVGLLAVLQQILLLCQEYHISKGSITVYCDNITALHRIFHTDIDFVNPKIVSADIVSAAVKVLHMIPITVYPRHIRGHQDKDLSFDKLTYPHQLNVFMDSIAKDTARNRDKLAQHIDFRPHPLSFLLPSIRDQQNHIHQRIKHTSYMPKQILQAVLASRK